MQTERPVTEKDVILVGDGQEQYTIGCSGFGSLLGGALHSCLDRFINAVEKRYRASKVKLDEWVIVELEPERKRVQSRQPSSRRLWLDIPDSDHD